MNEPLDDFSTFETEVKPFRKRSLVYSVYIIFVLILINSCAFLQSYGLIRFTPIFGELTGQIASFVLLVGTIFCYKAILKAGWMKATLLGFLILLVAFTLAFQIGHFFQKEHAFFPFWTITSTGYALFSVGIIEILAIRIHVR